METKVNAISDALKAKVANAVNFGVTLLQSIQKVAVEDGTFDATVEDEAHDRDFVAKNGDNKGKRYMVLECLVKLETGDVCKARISPNSMLAIGDTCKVSKQHACYR